MKNAICILSVFLLLTACNSKNEEATTQNDTAIENNNLAMQNNVPVDDNDLATKNNVKIDDITAEQVVNYFAANGMPIGNLEIRTEETDSNSLLGKPGQYISKVNFEDERTLNDYTNVDHPDYSPENTVEIFKNKEDMQKRYDYVKSVTEALGALFFQYMYSTDTILLRLEQELSVAEAQEYEKLLLELEDNLNKVVSAPAVTRKIGSE